MSLIDARRGCPTGASSIRRRWLIAVSALWAVLLLLLAAYAVRRGSATVRPETTIAQALPTVDRATLALAGAVPPGAVVTITGYRPVDASCPITAVRTGARYERVVDGYVPVGREQALVARLAQRLPRSWGVQVESSGSRPFTADAGDYVAVRGRISGPGQVEISVDTGCRPTGGAVREPGGGAPDGPTAAALAALGVEPARAAVHRVACPAGAGYLTTAEVSGPAKTRPGTPVIDTPHLYVARLGAVGVVVDHDRGTVSASTAC